MITATAIQAGDESVNIRLMDESWIVNQCAGGHPFKPTSGIVWEEADRCARLPKVPGNEFQNVLARLRDTYGNCAAIAWHEERVLGHIVWMPRHEARRLRATGCQFFGPEEEDGGTLVVVNLAFCSLSGHCFRGQGVGRAMASMMIAWARENGWQRIEVYDTTGGLFPWDWFDVCIPPRPFWESMGFTAFNRRLRRYTEEELSALMADNPRNNEQEQEEKRRTVARLQAGQVEESAMGNFDFGMNV